VVEGYLLDEPEFLDELVARCAAHGRAIALDLGQEPIERHRDDLLRHLGAGAIRYLFLRSAEAATLTGLDAEQALGALSAPGTTVVIKADGEYLVQGGGKLARVPCDALPAVDATGADDAFEAGFLWASGRGWTPVEACTAGDLVAACVGEAPGTRVEPGRWAVLQRDLAALSGR